MKKKDVKYYIFIALILITTIVFEVLKPKQIDWRFTLEQKDKIPYGTYVLFNTIKEIFPNKKIIVNKKTTWELNKQEDNSFKNYIYISKGFKPGKSETQTLLKLAETGNNIFISAHFFGGTFSDTLKFGVSWSNIYDSISELNFYNKKLKRIQPYIFKKSASFMIFAEADTANCEALAYDKKGNLIFFRQPFGKGYFYIGTTPEVFTNYAMIKEKNYEFAYKMLSYLPVRNTVWDEYYKPFRKAEKTSLSFFLSEKSLKSALITLLLLTFLFVFFSGKRRQRIIPIINSFENKTAAFVHTLSGLYYKSKNHKDIALKRFVYFNNFIKTKYNINLLDNENLNLEKTAQKMNLDIDLLKKLLSYHSKINNLENISVETLMSFNEIIEEIYEICK